MDVSLTSGLSVSTIGIVTVFMALVVLVGAVSMTGRMVARSQAGAPEVPAPRTPASSLDVATDGDLRAVAAAAFAAHLRRRVPVRRAHGAFSLWSSAGRLRQLARFQR
ncbi:MAG: OadG family protein [Myxococcota bacterium]